MTSQQLRTFLRYFVPFGFLLGLAFLIFLAVDYQHQKRLISANEQVQVRLAKTSLVRDFEQVLPDINVLANEQHVQQFVKGRRDADRELMLKELVTFAARKRLYCTIRFLDLSGNELARVDYRDGRAEVAADDALQNKAGRYYFRDSKSLGRGELYISPIDLNVEFGRIETPYVPTIRFATPVYDDAGVKHGILVLNYLAELMLQHFDEMLTNSAGHVALLNGDGYYIRSHRKEREWGFMFDNGQTFAEAHRDAWQAISSRPEGQVVVDDGLFSFVTIFPLEIIGGFSETEVENQHVGHHHVDPQSYQWKIVSDVSTRVLQDRLKSNLFGAPGLVILMTLFLGTVGCWQYALNRIEREALRRQVELHAKLYESTGEGVLITDREKRIIAANDGFMDITGYSEKEVIGRNPSLLSSGKHDAAFYKKMWMTLDGTGSWEGEIVNRRKDGAIYTEWLRISAVKDDRGDISNYVAIFSDITSKKASEEVLQWRAYHDPLTGLSNRLSFNERLDQDISRIRRSQGKLALLYIDLDRFKPVNDIHGHQAGDFLLKEVADRLKSMVREMDTVARVGGDEFIVLLAEVDTAEHAAMVAGNIRKRLQEPVMFEGASLQVGASIGIAVFPDDAPEPKALLAVADEAMYAIKHDRS